MAQLAEYSETSQEGLCEHSLSLTAAADGPRYESQTLET